jgi:hypothetical protein
VTETSGSLNELETEGLGYGEVIIGKVKSGDYGLRLS